MYTEAFKEITLLVTVFVDVVDMTLHFNVRFGFFVFWEGAEWEAYLVKRNSELNFINEGNDK